MTIGGGIVLGIVQGLTEFLPVSSSGHLILARELFGYAGDHGLAFDAILQLATTLAVIIYFRADLLRIVAERDWRLIKALVLGTIPAVIAGLLLESWMESSFRSAGLVALTLVLGSALMWYAERVRAPSPSSPLTPRSGFLIGLFQTLALVPGMSRSGSTISGGLILGLTRETATRFSFLLSIPILLGTGAKKFLDLAMDGTLTAMTGELIAGALAAFVVGYACIAFLMRYLKSHSLMVFVWYRLLLAGSVLVMLSLR